MSSYEFCFPLFVGETRLKHFPSVLVDLRIYGRIFIHTDKQDVELIESVHCYRNTQATIEKKEKRRLITSR